MERLTPEEREALFADMRRFLEPIPKVKVSNDDLTVEKGDLGHGWSGDMP